MKPGPMSLQYCLSMSACERMITTAAIDGIISPSISSLMPKIQVIAGEGISPLNCKLNVIMRGGAIFEKVTTFDTKGFGFLEEGPLVKSLVPQMKISEHRVTKAIEMTRDLETCSDMTSLIDLIIPEG